LGQLARIETAAGGFTPDAFVIVETFETGD
jgi:hypothetical protein